MLFRLAVATPGLSTGEFFASRSWDVDFPPDSARHRAVVRVAPYVVGTFGEALVWLEERIETGEGQPIRVWSGKRVVAEGTVTELTDERAKPEA